eukprot:CAMPEP_0202389140 /NCGR_PEP_ID=MMETSP1127-20130417/81284_1 /ASSEMBLY_ACC=CAM_ASM_000462 /TAXON_ID=3047 /ORGANISM="Dunaliella tertiolecta, Strain CCMP1320" /LENGTH=74 /DNA_ID=CAMNT_0048990795 /DNA_START=290 /DNA_END=511 /DNA_ORIENTATION=+
MRAFQEPSNALQHLSWGQVDLVKQQPPALPQRLHKLALHKSEGEAALATAAARSAVAKSAANARHCARSSDAPG